MIGILRKKLSMMNNITYHLMRKDREIKDKKIIEEIIQKCKYMTLALCKNNLPYLVTLSYGYDIEKEVFYFHSANEGRKIDYLRENPNVYGQILVDGGYSYGNCSHLYRTLNFTGIYKEMSDDGEKIKALTCMIKTLEKNPDSVLKDQVIGKKINAKIGIIENLKFSAKGNF